VGPSDVLCHDIPSEQTIEDDDDPLLWGAEAIRRELNLKSERQVRYMFEHGLIDAWKHGKWIVSTRKRSRRSVMRRGHAT
jgi:hypothetical protein